jgi:hypothetical protein
MVMRGIRIIGGIIVVIASLLILIGSLLPWERNRGVSTGISNKGMEGPWVITLIAGMVIVIMGILTILLEQNAFPPIVAALGGLGSTAIAVLNLVYITGRFSEISAEYVGRSGSEGLYIVLVGGLLVVVGSAAGIIGSISESKKYTAMQKDMLSK